ncbi:hypothetical protein HYW32_00655 [Candidatus Berkelbacteria bacterium]|nr:hypothetical protein [Candidatus Berkelbacteria bacterium]
MPLPNEDRLTRWESLLAATQRWINFYNNRRPHQGISNLSPNAYAQRNGLKIVSSIDKLTVQSVRFLETVTLYTI